MEQIVAELKKIVNFKDTTDTGDIVLVLTENPQAYVYGLVRGFERDDTRSDEWWHVTLKLLTVPIQDVTWTLRREQYTGEEVFSMGGDKRFVKAVDLGDPHVIAIVNNKKDDSGKGPSLKVIK